MSALLLQQLADKKNIVKAFRSCSRGKRASRGYRMIALDLSRNIVLIAEQLASGTWNWQPYHSFVVSDPKRRLIYAAPFRDRIVHHAIHQIIEPYIDKAIPKTSWACRRNMGSRAAAAALAIKLETLGGARYTVKLDVADYFASINHSILFEKLQNILPDRSLDPILDSLLTSLPAYKKAACGIPLGNLTSQLFANFYLSDLDRIAATMQEDVYYIRYMDDMVLVGHSKKKVLDLMDLLLEHGQNHLKLRIPHYKRVHLAADPVPFLGYLLQPPIYQVLARTKRRHQRQLRKMKRASCRLSTVEQVKTSFAAFENFNPNTCCKESKI